ncbi:MAG: exodeoxyribonuclease VII large subunit [Pseudomonadota bacterium]
MDLIDEDSSPGANAPEFTVSELSGAVKRTIEGAFEHVRVRGEIGRVSRPRSGHIYLDLKDDRAVLSGIIWKGVASRLDVQPEEGMEVVTTGRLTTYPGQSRYQIIIESLAPAGMGALMALLEKRKQALGAEGLFAVERKRPIPYLPRRVGVVTSPSGAVIRDILHRLGERFPLPVDLWPVAVQGQKCAEEVAAAIRGFNAMEDPPDVLIVARGGGSVEDLWGFNEEIVVRAVADSAIPVISAVGHETDTTLIDLAADLRAPTPTAAAELAAPVRGELLATIAALQERRERALSRILEESARRLRDLLRAAPRPMDMLVERRQRLDHASERLPAVLSRAADRKRIALTSGPAGRFGPRLLTERTGQLRERVSGAAARLLPAFKAAQAKPAQKLEAASVRLAAAPNRMSGQRAEGAKRLSGISGRLDRAGLTPLTAAQERLAANARLLETLSYKSTLSRGYAVVRDDADGLINSAAKVAPGAALSIQFADDRVGAVASGGSARAKKPAKQKPPSDQGSLDL